nr:MAG TPA: hypothetical protein [Caudoviricetes sp.]
MRRLQSESMATSRPSPLELDAYDWSFGVDG